MIWWDSRPRRGRDAAWLLLAPLGIAAYAAWLGLVEGDALRFLDVQEAWSRDLAVPLAGAWDGLVAAVGRRAPARVRARARPSTSTMAAGDPFRIAAINIMLFATLVFALVALRRACSGGCRARTAPGSRSRCCCRSRSR